MTEKQEKILKSALSLFASNGYAATSTSSVAKEAGVSEGLIFRHFKNKEGLLAAVLSLSTEKTKQAITEIVMASDAKSVLRKTIELPFGIDQGEYKMWKLIYALKWQLDSYDLEAMNPLKRALKQAFSELNYQNPDAEAELLLMFMDGAATSLLLHPPQQVEGIKKSLLTKYQL